MIDREYIKLNTSIQTASNSQQLIEDENGNVPAIIELDLPGDIFTSKDGGKKVDKVSMLTSKMRLSLNQTPLAQIPTIPYAPNTDVILSSCQLDVYPYTILDNEVAKPNPNSMDVGQTFPHYKDHTTTYRIKAYGGAYGTLDPQDLEELITINNCPGYDFPKSDRFYSIFKEVGIFDENKHLMNLTINSARRDSLEIQSNCALVKSLGAISQMLQDGLENAISYASESDNTTIDVYLIPVQYASTFPSPAPITSTTVFVDEFNEEMYIWYWEPSSEENSLTSDLEWAVKPKVMFDEQSMRISYDTAAFKNMVPVIWNTPFVDTYDVPEQMTIDTLRNSVWDGEPPPKRVYQYDVTTVDDPASYNFALKNPINCGLMNIIGNREMRDTFSFLPWIKVKLTDLSLYRESSYKYKIQYVKSGYVRTTVSGDFYIESTSTAPNYYYQKTSVEATDTRFLKYTFKVPVGGDPNNQSLRYDQNVELVETLSSATALTFTDGSLNIAQMPYTLEEVEGDPFDTSLPPQTYSSYETDDTNYSVGDQILGNDIVSLPTKEETTELGTAHYSVERVSGNAQLRYSNTIGCYLRLPYGAETPPSNKWLPGIYIGSQEYISDISPSLTDDSDFRKWVPSTNPSYIDSSHNTSPDRTYDIYYYYWEILVDNDSNRNFFNAVMNVAIRNSSAAPPFFVGQMKYIQKTTTEAGNVLTYTRVVSEDESTVSRKAIIPNLDLDEEMCFYMLDCITAKMDIGSQEVIQTNKNLFEVQTTPSTETKKTNWVIDKYNSTNILPATVDNRSYEKYAFIGGLPSNWYIDEVPVTYDYEEDGETITTTENVTAEYMVDSLQLVTFTYDNKTYYTIQGDFQSGSHVYFKSRTNISNEHKADETTTVTGETTTTYSNDLSLEPTSEPVVTTLSTTSSEYQNIQQTISVTNAGYGAPPNFSGSQLPDSWIFMPMGQIVTSTSIAMSFYDSDTYVITDVSMNRFIPTALENADYSQTFTGNINNFIPDGETEAISLEDVTFTRYEWAIEGDFEQASAEVSNRSQPVTSFDADVTFPTLSQLAADDLIQGITAVDAWGYTLNRIYEEESYKTTVTETQSLTIEAVDPTYKGNVRLGFTWNGLPTVTLSPITSFVLRLGGIQSTQEILPVNIATNNYAASQISSIPIIENYFSTASSFRELHDELVVIKDQFTTAAVYTLPDTSGQERIIKFMAQYITKDGKIHQLYIPKNGVFWLQLTFAIDYVPVY